MSAPLTPEPRTVGTSPKTVWAGVVALIIGVAIAVLNAVQDANLLGSLPVPLQVILLAAIPPILVALAAYQARPGVVTQTPVAPGADGPLV